jgi:hypothetical protein
MCPILTGFCSCFEIEERVRTPKKFRFPSFEAVNWLAAQKLKNDLVPISQKNLQMAHHKFVNLVFYGSVMPLNS